jgi:hypothetical protein
MDGRSPRRASWRAPEINRAELGQEVGFGTGTIPQQLSSISPHTRKFSVSVLAQLTP